MQLQPMTKIANKPFTQLTNLNITDELRFKGELFGPREFESSVATGNVTAVNGNWIEAGSGITVTLDPDSEIDDEIIVSNGDGTLITIDALTVDIKYKSTTNSLQTQNQGTTLHFQMFGDGDTKYWRIR